MPAMVIELAACFVGGRLTIGTRWLSVVRTWGPSIKFLSMNSLSDLYRAGALHRSCGVRRSGHLMTLRPSRPVPYALSI